VAFLAAMEPRAIAPIHGLSVLAVIRRVAAPGINPPFPGVRTERPLPLDAGHLGQPVFPLPWVRPPRNRRRDPRSSRPFPAATVNVDRPWSSSSLSWGGPGCSGLIPVLWRHQGADAAPTSQ